MSELIRKVNNGGLLTMDEAKFLFCDIINHRLTDAQIASALISMKYRNERPEEIAGAILAMTECMVPFNHNKKGTIDTCGTGGDGKSTVNISTAVSVVLSSMGHPVLKHGNVALSGRFGSADILEMLDIPCKLKEIEAQNYFLEHDFIFLFAPYYHPALKNVAHIRKEVMTPTIFNFLGPLANPGNPDYQIIGIGRKDFLKTYIDAALLLGKKNILIYTSDDGYDEVSTYAPTHGYILRNGQIEPFYVNPKEFFTPFELPHVTNKEEALMLFLDGLKGEDDKIAKIFALNTASALFLMGKDGMKDCFKLAYEHIKSGKAFKKLNQLRSSHAFQAN